MSPPGPRTRSPPSVTSRTATGTPAGVITAVGGSAPGVGPPGTAADGSSTYGDDRNHDPTGADAYARNRAAGNHFTPPTSKRNSTLPSADRRASIRTSTGAVVERDPDVPRPSPEDAPCPESGT